MSFKLLEIKPNQAEYDTLLKYCEVREAESFNIPWKKNDFESLLQNPFMHVFIGVNDNGPVGYASVSLVFEEAEIMRICIDSKERRKGYGYEFLKCLLTYFFENGGEKIFLEVRKSNVSAIKLYEKSGFKAYSIRKNYYENGEDAINYSLTKENSNG